MLALQEAMQNSATKVPGISTWLRLGAGRKDVEPIYQHLVDALMDGHLKPGVKLTESALCKTFNCSRGNLRQALLLLEHDHMVDLLPNRGAFVHRADVHEMEEVFSLRVVLETHLIEQLFARELSEADVGTLYSHIMKEQQAYEAGRHVDWIRLSNNFHLKMAALYHNQTLHETLAAFCLRTSLMSSLFDVPGEVHTCSYAEHRAIVDALLAGDKATCEALLIHHLSHTRRRIGAMRDKKGVSE